MRSQAYSERLTLLCLAALAAVLGPVSALAQERVVPTFDRSADSLRAFYTRSGRDAASSYSAIGYGGMAVLAAGALAVSIPLAQAGPSSSAYGVIVAAAGALLAGTVIQAWRGSASPPSYVRLSSLPRPVARDAFLDGYANEVHRKRRLALLWAPVGALAAGGALLGIFAIRMSGG